MNNNIDFNFATHIKNLAFKAPTKRLKKQLDNIYKSYIFKCLSTKEKAKIICKKILFFVLFILALGCFTFGIFLLIGLCLV